MVGWLSLILLGVSLAGVVAGVLRHTLIVRTWLVAMYGSMKLITRKTTQMGHVLPQRVPTGEILSISDSDSDQFGAVTEVLTRALGALIAYLMIAGLVFTMSWQLGLVVLITAPLLVILAAPLLRPLERRQDVERTRLSDLTSLATDIVGGLRILRGIGGERTFSANYDAQSQRTRRAGVDAGRWQAAVEGASVLFSGLFLVAVTWLGAVQLSAGVLSVGDLISLFGYAVFMVWPIQTFFELAQEWVRAVISARKAIAVMQQQPPWRAPEPALSLPTDAEIADDVSGFVARPGEWTIVASAMPEDSAALADRLGRYLPSDHDPVSLEDEKGLTGRAARRAARTRVREERERQLRRDAELADRRWGVRIGPVDLADVPIEAVRDRVLVSDTASAVFAGTLQSAIDPHGRLSRDQAERAMWTAAAEDVYEVSARRLAGPDRRTGPRPVRWPAPAAGAGPRPGRRPRHPDLGRADLGGGRTHRGADRLPPRRAPPRSDHDHDHRLTAAPALRRPASPSCWTAGSIDSGTHEELVQRSAGYRRLVDRNFDDPSTGSGHDFGRPFARAPHD